MHVDRFRHLPHAYDRVGVVVALLDYPVLRRDLAMQRQAHAEDTGAFHLCDHAVRVHDEAGINREPQFLDVQLALPVDAYLGDRAHGAQERAVHRDTEAMAVRQVPAPAGHRRHFLDNRLVTRGIDRMDVE